MSNEQSLITEFDGKITELIKKRIGMIPTFDVKIEIRVDMTRVCSPPWKIIHQKEGLIVFATNILDMQRFAVGLHRAFSSAIFSERKHRQLTKLPITAPAPPISRPKFKQSILKQ